MDFERILDPPSNLGNDHLSSPKRVALLSRTVVRSPIVKWVLPGRFRGRHHNDVFFVGDYDVQLQEWDHVRGSFCSIVHKAGFPSRIACAAVLSLDRSVGQVKVGEDDMDIDSRDSTSLSTPIVLLLLENAQLLFLKTKGGPRQPVEFTIDTQPLPALGQDDHQFQYLAVDPGSRAIAVAGLTGPILIQHVRALENQYISMVDLITDTVMFPIDSTILRFEFLPPPAADKEKIILVVVGNRAGLTSVTTYIWDRRLSPRPEKVQSFSRRLGNEHGNPNHLIPLKNAHYMIVCDLVMAVYQVFMDGHSEQTSVSMLRSHNSKVARIHSLFDGSSLSPPQWICWAKPTRRSDWIHEAIYLGREDGFLVYVVLKNLGDKLVIAEQSDGEQLDSRLGPVFAILDTPLLGLKTGDAEAEDASGLHVPGYMDAFIFVDEYGAGGVFEIGSLESVPETNTWTREQAHLPRYRDSFLTRAPVRAITVLEATGSTPVFSIRQGLSGAEITNPQEKVYIAGGEAPNGFVAEIGYGLQISEATLLKSGQVGLDLSGVNRSWLVEFEGRPHIALSFPWQTVWASLDKSHQSASPIKYLPDCDQDESTLAVTNLSSRFTEWYTTIKAEDGALSSIVGQVTRTKVSLLRLHGESQQPVIIKSWDIGVSTIGAIERVRGLVLTAAYSDDGFQMIVRRVALSDGAPQLLVIGKFNLDFEMSCAAFPLVMAEAPDIAPIEDYDTELASKVYVGTTDGHMCTFEVKDEVGLQLLSTTRMTPHQRGPGQGIESIVGTVFSQQSMIICGLRNGLLQAFRFSKDTEGAEVKHGCSLTLGSTAVRVEIDELSFGKFFAYAGHHVCSLDFTRPEHEEPILLSIGHSNPSLPPVPQARIDSLCFYQDISNVQAEGTLLVSISENTILTGYLDRSAKTLVSRMPLVGTPTRLLRSRRSRSLLVACTINHVDARAGTRFSIPRLFLLDTSRYGLGTISDYDRSRNIPSFPLESGERLTDAIELTISNHNAISKNHNFFVVSSTWTKVYDTAAGINPIETGRLRWLRVSSNSEERSMTCQKESFEDEPITTMCEVGPNVRLTTTAAFVYCSGRELMIRDFEPLPSGWPRRKLWTLQSPATKITMDKDHIFISTSAHSFIVLVVVGNTQQSIGRTNETMDIKAVVAVAEPQHSLSHLKLSTDVCIVSAKDGIVSALDHSGYHEGERNRQLGVRASVEARLPTSITHFVKCKTRPPWKAGRPPPGVVERDIIGTSIDGSIYAFSILTEAALRLLRFVHNMCLRDGRICPMSDHTVFTRKALEPRMQQPKDWHVDGDVILRLLDQEEGKAMLEEMLNTEPVRGLGNGGQLDFGTAVERRKRFEMLVTEAIGEDWLQYEDWLGGLDAVTSSLRLMRRLLDMPF